MRSLPPGDQLGQNMRNVAGAGVVFWHQVHAGRLVQLGDVWIRLHGQSLGGYPLFLLLGMAIIPWAPCTGWWWGWSPAVMVSSSLENC